MKTNVKKKCLVVADCDENETYDFVKAINDSGIFACDFENHVCNGERSFSYNVKRIFNYFAIGLKSVFARNKYDIIIFWQQFYGIFYCFFCNLFFIKNTRKAIIMTFIYKEKKGFIGKIYFKFLRFSLKNNNYKFLTVSSSSEIAKYSKIFCINPNNIKFLPWSRNADQEFDNSTKGNFLISIGRSNRDFNFIESCLADFPMETFVFSDVEKRRVNGNVHFTGTVKNANAALARSFCVIISTDDPTVSAGQTLLITAMSLKKPIIVTKCEALTDDYITNGVNGLIIDKNKESLISAIEFLKNKSNYDLISESGYKIWENNYTIYKMGTNILNLINSFHE